MTSLQTGVRQISNNSGYYIAVSSCVNLIFATPLGDVASWANTATAGTAQGGAMSTAVSTVNRQGTLFRDMGKSIISSGGYYRKVQLVVPQAAAAAGQVGTGSANGSTFGVGGYSGVSGQLDFFTGYIKLGFDGVGPNAPVAQFGR
jgi:hypothetical protein